jgi:uridylate kinase
MKDHLPYKRVLLKISGEALASLSPSSTNQGIDQSMLQKIARDIREVHELGVQICLVVGGGNIFRGLSGSAKHGIDRATSDYMGMLATVINALALQNAIEMESMPCRVMSAIPMHQIGETYIRRRALNHLEKGRIVIFAAGTGNPYFTTDTAAALRASEMGCDLLLKATKVDGVYSADPMKDKNAVHYSKLSYSDVLGRELGVMDTAAISLTKENGIPIAVFSIYPDGGFSQVLKGNCTYTLISDTN